MRLSRSLIIGFVWLCILTARHEHVFAQKKPAPIAPAEALKEGWEEIDKRLVFLMVRLANVEAGPDAINKVAAVKKIH